MKNNYDDSALYQMFELLNDCCFDGKLDTPEIKWGCISPFVNGLYRPSGLLATTVWKEGNWQAVNIWGGPRITIDTRLKENYTQTQRTMLHEMVHHAGYHNHEEGFQAELKRANEKLQAQ